MASIYEVDLGFPGFTVHRSDLVCLMAES